MRDNLAGTELLRHRTSLRLLFFLKTLPAGLGSVVEVRQERTPSEVRLLEAGFGHAIRLTVLHQTQGPARRPLFLSSTGCGAAACHGRAGIRIAPPEGIIADMQLALPPWDRVQIAALLRDPLAADADQFGRPRRERGCGRF